MTHFTYITASLIAVVSIARTARLLVHDTFPPVVWLRSHLIAWSPQSWADLWSCQFCLAPYLAAGMGVWVWLSGLDTVWWIVNGWWAASYVAAMLVAYDQPEG